LPESTLIPAETTDPGPLPHASTRLGHREREVLEIVWAQGSGTVEEVSRSLPIKLAYTTVMTTLDRLFKKGLLLREKHDRAFRYTPALTPQEVESQRARALVDRFLQSNAAQPEMLLSCLVDALGEYDGAMLDQLEGKIRAARESLNAADAAAKEDAQ
jgi:predicted transcriptional regulator